MGSKNFLLFGNFEKQLILYSAKNANNIPKNVASIFGIILCQSCRLNSQRKWEDIYMTINYEHKNLHFDNEQDLHVTSKNYEEND